MNIKQNQNFTTITDSSLWMHQVTVFINWKYCPCVWSLGKSLKWLITGTLITCADNEANLANQHIKLKLMMRSRHKNDVYTKLKLSMLLIVEINDDISKFHIVISYWSSTWFHVPILHICSLFWKWSGFILLSKTCIPLSFIKRVSNLILFYNFRITKLW